MKVLLASSEAIPYAKTGGLADVAGSLVNELRNISPEFSDDVVKVFDIERSLAARSIIGGTGPEALLTQLAAAQAVVEAEA